MDPALRFVTVHQPWASLVAAGHVRALARDYPIELGELAIVAARSFGQRQIATSLAGAFLGLLGATGYASASDIPRGAVVGVVDVVRCDRVLGPPQFMNGVWYLPTDDEFAVQITEEEARLGGWGPRSYAWRFASNRQLAEPITCQGARGVRALPPLLDALVRAQIAHTPSRASQNVTTRAESA